MNISEVSLHEFWPGEFLESLIGNLCDTKRLPHKGFPWLVGNKFQQMKQTNRNKRLNKPCDALHMKAKLNEASGWKLE